MWRTVLVYGGLLAASCGRGRSECSDEGRFPRESPFLTIAAQAARANMHHPTHQRCRMTRFILRYGIIAGLIVAVPWVVYMFRLPADAKDMGGLWQGYLLMLVALSMVFLGIKHYRDRVLGGVIKFGPAFMLGLGISAVASVLYMLGWELSQSLSKFDFADFYARSIVDAARAKGASAEELARASAQAQEFLRSYANPFFRLPMTFLEMFPVGILVSLISAGLLRNARFLPARHAG
jgi:hypothetical protein